MSEIIESSVVKALAAATLEFDWVRLNKVNPHFKNSYSDLAEYQRATRTALAKNGLVVTQTMKVTDGQVFLVTTLMHQSGQAWDSWVPLTAFGKGPQAFGSELTYLRRYCYAGILNISGSNDDDDGESAANGSIYQSHKAGGPPPPPPPPPRPTTDDPRAIAAKWTETVEDVFAKCQDMQAFFQQVDKITANRTKLREKYPEMAARIDVAIKNAHDRLAAPHTTVTSTPGFEASLIDETGEVIGLHTDPDEYAMAAYKLWSGVVADRTIFLENNAEALRMAAAVSPKAKALAEEMLHGPVPHQVDVPEDENGWTEYVQRVMVFLPTLTKENFGKFLASNLPNFHAAGYPIRVQLAQACTATAKKLGLSLPIKELVELVATQAAGGR